MADEKENSPKVNLGELELMGAPVKIKLDCAKAISEGVSKKFNNPWFLWVGFVENVTVEDKDRKKIPNYTGKVIFFPSEKLNEELIKQTNGKTGAVVTIQRIAAQGRKGLITKYICSKLSDGEETAGGSPLTPGELKLVTDADSLMKKGIAMTEMDFIKASQDPRYGGQISLLKAKELYSFLTK